MSWYVRLLGPLAVTRGTVPVPVPAPKQRVVLAALALDAGRRVSIDELAGRIWGEHVPARARNTVQVYVGRLRCVLADPDVIETHGDGYVLRLAPLRTDVGQLEHMVRRAASMSEPAALAELLGCARTLWRGEPLQDVPSEELHRDAVPVVREAWLQAVEGYLRAEFDLGRQARHLVELDRLTRRHPLREGLWWLWMRALADCGRPGDALQAFNTLARALRAELGTDPGSDLRLLHLRILDPSATPPPDRPLASAIRQRGRAR